MRSEDGKLYADIYSDLLDGLRRKAVWNGGRSGILLTILPSLGLSIWIFYAIEELNWLNILSIVIAFTVLLLIGYYFLLLIFASQSVMQAPEKLACRVAAQILMVTSKPYNNSCGLNYSEIHKLQQLATIEQSAADWRGNFTQLIIIGTISTIFVAAPTVSNLINAPSEPSLFGSIWRSYFFPIPVWFTILSFFVLILFIGRTFTSLFIYFKDFVSKEAANRAVLFGCQEAINLLEAYELADKEVLSFLEKRALLEKLGFRLVKSNSITLKLIAIDYLDISRGNTWIILNIQKYNCYLNIKGWVDRFFLVNLAHFL